MKPWQEELWGWAQVSECHEHAPHLDKRFDRLLVTLEATHEEQRAIKLREALEFVTLWAFVDQDAWKKVVASCGTPWDVYVPDRGSYLPPKYVIVLETRHWVKDYSEKQTQ
ncbi:hypothetical protein Poli38472_011210 [Pythium oligandrum]|uniref:Uncharacterized protein n=1 Tax=Pythium oligandrum TaxID=41045 RepID=A0A8K1FKX1_PYTOL|nr:hypothetical protein Poli38472_011210 [Pythium oligandrum]|eukprot:TMW67590.1 hypothetical protein Poli38472_011210 [Pythium oligandrum]